MESAEELDAMLATFGVVVIPDGSGEFQHNGAIHVVDRQGRLVRILDYDTPLPVIQDIVAAL